MKFLAFLIVLLFAPLARGATFQVVIDNQAILDAGSALCPVLRASLPPAKRTPWSPDICVKYFAIKGMLVTYIEQDREEIRTYVSDKKQAARDLFGEGPVSPTPAPVATPTTTPTPTP